MEKKKKKSKKERILESPRPLPVHRPLFTFVDSVLSQGMLGVVCLLFVSPLTVELVNLTGHLHVLHHVVRLEHLAEPALSQERCQQVPLVQQRVCVEAGLILVENTLHFTDVQITLTLKAFNGNSNITLLLKKATKKQRKKKVGKVEKRKKRESC